MDRYLFRGKCKCDESCIESNGWAYGSLDDQGVFPLIRRKITRNNRGKGNTFEVSRATIGQCTGLRDKSGTLIFEGDIIRQIHESPDVDNFTGVVSWHEHEHGWQIDTRKPGEYMEYIGYAGDMYEIIGNIHEHKNILDYGSA